MIRIAKVTTHYHMRDRNRKQNMSFSIPHRILDRAEKNMFCNLSH